MDGPNAAPPAQPADGKRPTKDIASQASFLLEKFDFKEAVAILEKVGGFYAWTEQTMKAEVLSRFHRMEKGSELIATSSGGLRVGKDRYGFLFIELDVYGMRIHPYEVKP